MKHASWVMWFAIAVAVPTVVWGLLTGSGGGAGGLSTPVTSSVGVPPTPYGGAKVRPVPIPITPGAGGSTAAEVSSPVFQEARSLPWPAGFEPPPGPLMPRAIGTNLIGERELVVRDGRGDVWFARVAPAGGGEPPAILDATPVTSDEDDRAVLGGPAGLGVADVNYDGERDLIAQDPATGALAAYPTSVDGQRMRVGRSFPLLGESGPLVLPVDTGGHMLATDWDDDGWVDLLYARSDGSVACYSNVREPSAPTFAAPVDIATPPTLSPETCSHYVSHADMNGDGRRDLLCTSAGGCVSCRLAGGAPGSLASGPPVPVLLPSGDDYFLAGDADTRSFATLTDVTGDGLLDMVFGTSGSDLGYAVAVDVRALARVAAGPTTAPRQTTNTDAAPSGDTCDYGRVAARLAEWGLPGC
jgi:hypothetical protein